MKTDNIPTNLDKAIEYSNDIITGRINACKYTIQACKLFQSNLDRPDLYYNSGEVDKVISFINTLYLTEQLTPTKFYLQNWQTFIIANIYGFYFKENNKRKHKYIYIEIPRKNGKSMLVNALSIYHLIFDTEAQIVVSANSREQAKNVNFKQAKNYCTQLDPKKKHLKQLYSKIKYEDSELIVTASDSKRLDGLNMSVGIIDELHEAKDSSMYDVFKSSQGSRINPLLLVVTTAGFNIQNFCYSMRTYATEILAGKKTDDNQFSLIYSLDEGDDYELESNWYKSNPNLDISVQKDFIISEVTKAKNNPVEKTGVLVKNFNVWLQNKGEEQHYIDAEFINKASKVIDINDEMFQGLECYAGADLGSVSDITAVSYMITLDSKIYFFQKYYLPENSINISINKKQFKQWANDGYITLTEGNVTDYNYITNDLLTTNKSNELIQISYDSWNSVQWAIDATEADLNLKPFSQSTGSINKPTKELSRLIMSDNVIIQYNPVTNWMFQNVIIKEYNNNIRPDKSKRSNKIDGVMAIITNLGGFLNISHNGFNVW